MASICELTKKCFVNAIPTGTLLLALLAPLVAGKRSLQYNLPGKYCGRSAREIDGAIIYSSTNALYANSACILKFKSDDSLFTSKRIMIHGSGVITDCSVKVSIYFDSDSYGTPAATYDCNSPNPPAPLKSTGRYVTIRLDKTTTTGYNFQIILTTFKDKMFCGGDYDCGSQNGYCIDDDLQCDSVKNCLDGRDENGCSSIVGVRHVGTKSMIATIVIVMALVLICTGVLVFYCKRRRAGSQGTVIRTNQPLADQSTNMTSATPVVAGAYPTQPQYNPGYYPPPPAAANAPIYPPTNPGAQYPPPPAYGDAVQGPYPAPPPIHQQVAYNAQQQQVAL